MSISCLLKLKNSGEISEEAFNQINRELNDNVPMDKINSRLNTLKSTNKAKYKNAANTFKVGTNNKQWVDGEASKAKPGKESDVAGVAISDLITKSKGGTKNTPTNVEYLAKELSGRAKVPLSKHFNDLMSKFGGWVEPKKMMNDISHKINNPNIKMDTKVESIVKAMDESLTLLNDGLIKVGITPNITSLKQLAGLNTKIQNMPFSQFKEIVQPLVKDNEETLLKAWNAARQGEEVFNFNFVSDGAQSTYSKTIGGDHYSNLMAYIDKQSAQHAATQVFGNNPQKQLNNLIDDQIAKGVNIDTKQREILNHMFEASTGTLAQAMDPSMAAKLVSSFRGIATGSMLGGSPVMSLMDIPFSVTTLGQNGLSPIVFFQHVVKGLVSKGDRMSLARLGHQIDGIETALNLTSKFNPHASTSNAVNRFATSTLRLGGLIAFGDVLKNAVKSTFYYSLRDFKGSTFGGLRKTNPQLHKKLIQYGVNETDWNVIRKSMTDDDMMFDPLKVQDDIGSKIFRMVNEEGDYAVVTPGARSNYVTSLGFNKGTISGESIKALTQFKSTIVEQVITHLYRAAQQTGVKNKMGYAAQMLVGTSIVGAMVYEIKEITAGKTPVNPLEEPKKFISGTIEKAGLIPGISDILVPRLLDPKFTDGNPWTQMLTPASMSLPTNASLHLYEMLTAANEEKELKAKAKLYRDIARIFPNFWYTNALYKEYVVNYGSTLIDPKGEKARMRRMEKQAKKDGQTYFLKP